MSGFHHSVAVSPFPLCKFCKNYVSAVRISYVAYTLKNSVAPLPLSPAVAP